MRGILPSINRDFNPFHVIDLFPYPLKTLANRMFSDIFMGYRKRQVARNGVTDSRVNDSAETESFVDFNINDSRVARVVDTEDGIEIINITTDDDSVIPDINTIRRDAAPPKRKKLVTTHLTQAVHAANKIKKKYEKKKKMIGKKSARISTDGTLFKKVNEKKC